LKPSGPRSSRSLLRSLLDEQDQRAGCEVVRRAVHELLLAGIDRVAARLHPRGRVRNAIPAVALRQVRRHRAPKAIVRDVDAANVVPPFLRIDADPEEVPARIAHVPAVRLATVVAEPGDVLQAVAVVVLAVEELRAAKRGVRTAELNHPPRKVREAR